MSNVIETKDLTRVFGELVAVDHINLNIERGEVFGFLGPNGAGKTTTTKLLCTILNPSSGSAWVCGYDVVQQRDRVRECIGIVFQDPAIDTFLTGKENLDFHARMYHMGKKTRDERIAEVLDLLELKGKENIKVDDYSGGMQRRFEVARGFLNHPEVLFLDEPTLGLDIRTRRNLWSYIRMLNEKEGTTIILTTHYIEEADYLCGRVAIIDHGRVAAIDSPARLKEVVGLNLIFLQMADGGGAGLASALRGLDWIKRIEAHNSVLELSVAGAEDRIPQLIEFADEQGFVISSIEMRKPSLEDAFLHYTGRAIREEEGTLKDLRRARMIRKRSRK
ncbi:MAG: ATP-binding cassette domain-containing protein [Chloroflexota bacterium]|nr:ATP-binding cassette domain-containing protein [Chloroflexota bacterium]